MKTTVKKTTKKELKERCSAILKSTPIGSYLSPFDLQFIVSVFECHPQWNIKKGCGIAGVYVGKNSYGGKGFFIKREDHTTTDISFYKAIDGRPTKRSEVIAALRTAIYPVIQRFKKETVRFGVDTCPFTGKILTPQNTHIDHYDGKFREVVEGWIKDKDINELHARLNPDGVDGNDTYYFTDNDTIEDFLKYHNANTNLRAVSMEANLKMK